MTLKPIKLELTNFRGFTGTYDLTDITLITGPNRSGKTRILNALELALTGDVWNAKDDRNFTFDELTADGIHQMQVRVLFDDNFWISRRFTRKESKQGNITVKKELDFVGMNQDSTTKIRQAEQELAQRFTCSKYGLYLDKIVKAKVTERREILLNMLIGEQDERPLDVWIFEESVTIGQIKAESHSELERLTHGYVAAQDDGMFLLDRLTRIHNLSDTNLAASKTELEATTTMIRELGFGDAEAVDTSQIPGLEAELAELMRRWGRLNHNLGSAETAKKRFDVLTGEIKALKDKLSHVPDVRAKSEVDEARTELNNRREKEHAKIVEDYDGFTDKAKTAHAEAIEEIDVRISAELDLSASSKGDEKGLSQTIQTVSLEADDLTEKIETLQEHNAATPRHNCPLCDSEINPDEVIAILEGLFKEKDDLVKDARKDLQAAIEETAGHDEKIKKFRNNRTGAETAHRIELEGLEKTKRGKIVAFGEEYQKSFKPLDAELEAINQRSQIENNRVQKEAELNGIEIGDIPTIQGQLMAASTNRDNKQDELDKLKIAESNAQRKVELEGQQFNQQQKVTCLDAIKKATGPKGIQGQLLREKIDPFIEQVNGILQKFAPDMVFNIQFENDRGKESCQFGFTGRDGWVLFESASGVERALVLFAVVVALMQQERFVNCRVVLMDEIANLDQGMVPVMLQAAKTATSEGLIDTALFAGALRSEDIESIAQANLQDVLGTIIECGRESDG